MKKIDKVFITGLIFIGLSANSFAQTTTEEPTGRLPYRRLIVPTTKYEEVFDVNSSLQMVGSYRGADQQQMCLDVFDSNAVILRSVCIPTGTFRSVSMNDAGIVGGSFQLDAQSDAGPTEAFRWNTDDSLQTITRPTEAASLRHGEVTKVDSDGRIYGFFSDARFTSTSISSESVISFVSEGGSLSSAIIPIGSVSARINGAFDRYWFGSLTRPIASGSEVVGFLEDLKGGTGLRTIDSTTGIVGLAQDGSYLADFANDPSQFVSNDGNKIRLRFNGASTALQNVEAQTAILGSALTEDGYRVWRTPERENGDGFRVQRGNLLSHELTCALPVDAQVAPGVTRIHPGGTVLFGAVYGGNPVLFVPTATDALDNRCLLAHFEIPRISKSKVRVGTSCNSGYYLKERKKLPNGSKLAVTVRVIDGQGTAVVGAQVSLDVRNDGRPAITRKRTNSMGRVTLIIPFFDKSRVGGECSLADILVTKEGKSATSIRVLNPDGSCGSCA